MPIFKSSGYISKINNKILGTPWNPTRISGMLFWSNSNKKNITLVDNKITVWKDNSGYLNNGIQTYPSRQPYYIDNIINGYPALYFQSNKNITIPSLYMNRFTIFTVINSNDNNLVYEFGNNTQTATGFYLNGSTNTIGVSYSGLTSASIKNYTTNWLSSGNTWKIISHQYDGTHASHKMYINGDYAFTSTYFSYDKNPGNLNATLDLNLGSKYNATNGVDAYIAEYIVYDNYLSIDELNKIEIYLNNKYNIY